MRFVYLTTLYPAYVEQFYGGRDGLRLGTYAEQRMALSQDAFGWNGAWQEPLMAKGHELMEISANVEPLQRAWAYEKAVRWPPASWRTSIPLAQCLEFQPDVLLIDDLRNYSGEWLTELRKRVPSLRAILGVLGSPSFDWESVAACDAVLAITRLYESEVTAKGGRAYFFRHAFNSESRAGLVQISNPHGITFCGSIQRGSGYHVERERFFHDVLRRVPVELYVPQGAISPWRDRVTTFARQSLYVGMQALEYAGMTTKARRRLPIVGKAATWASMPTTSVDAGLRPHMRGALFGRSMLQKLLESFATLNIHGEAAGDEAVNMRLFEATGVGTCLLTDWKPSLSELFDEDEVVSFRSADEFVEKIGWLEANPGLRESIAAKGNRRTLQQHTFWNRAGDLLGVVDDVLKNKNARRSVAALPV